jgi:hypothetical protein
MGVNISAVLCARCRGPFDGEMSTPGYRFEDSVGNAEENPVRCSSDHSSRDCPYGHGVFLNVLCSCVVLRW